MDQQNNTPEGEAHVEMGVNQEDLFARATLAVSDGISRELGQTVRPEFFVEFGREAVASTFLFLRDIAARLPDEYVREIYITSFLQSVTATIAKVGIRGARGRLIEIASITADATYHMLNEAREKVRVAEAAVAQQAAAHQQAAQRTAVHAAVQNRAPAPTRLPSVVQPSADAAALIKAAGG